MHVMEVLLVATGLTGGLTLVWAARAAAGLFSRPPAAAAHFGPGTLDRVLRELSAARKEVLLFADSLTCPVVAQALVEAQARKAQVDVVLGAVAETDPESSLPFLLDSGLAPLIEDHAARLSGNVLLIDGRTLLVASGPFHPDEEQDAAGCHLIVCRDQPELIGPFREQLLGARTRARPARRTPGPAAVAPASFPSYSAPEPTPEPESYTTPEPDPMPPVVSLLSRPLATFDAPPQDDELRMPPQRPLPPALSDEDFDGESLPEQAPSGAPPVTLAAAELFARLRREVAARAEEPTGE